MTPADAIWQKANALVHAMLAMPFNAERAAGTLSRDAFRHYMIQDSLYLQGYARVLALGAAKAPGPDDILAFAKAAETAIVVERALHAGYLDQFGIALEDLTQAQASPTTLGYVNFMLAEATTGSFATLVGAILPCFWVYRAVGLDIAGRSGVGNFYQAWIDTYADPGFAAATEAMIAVYNRCHSSAGGPERAAMEQAFLTCCRYEWMFWTAAYHQEGWPIG